jgi:hypothetical protein
MVRWALIHLTMEGKARKILQTHRTSGVAQPNTEEEI